LYPDGAVPQESIKVTQWQRDDHTDNGNDGDIGCIVGCDVIQHRCRIEILANESPRCPATQVEYPEQVWAIFNDGFQFHPAILHF